MASPKQMFKNQFPLPETSQLPGFLASCPVLSGLSEQALALLASELKLVRYDEGTRFFTDESPNYRAPLRFVVHDRATWDSNRSADQKSAWMLSPGSVFGLEAVNDWGRRHELAGVWSRGEMPLIRCHALSVIWVLELPADRYDAVFLPEIGRAVLDKLFQMVPTMCSAPDIVATMREKPLFARAAPVHLYKLLEWAPTMKLWPLVVLNPDENQGDEPEPEPGPTALYYVIDGQLQVSVEDEAKSIEVGQMDGADLFTPEAEAQAISQPKAIGETTAVSLTRTALETCMRQIPAFARSLGPRDEPQKKGQP